MKSDFVDLWWGKKGNKVTDGRCSHWNCRPFQWVILNSSTCVLPYVNDGSTRFCIGETFFKHINEGQGLVIAGESNYSLSV